MSKKDSFLEIKLPPSKEVEANPLIVSKRKKIILSKLFTGFLENILSFLDEEYVQILASINRSLRIVIRAIPISLTPREMSLTVLKDFLKYNIDLVVESVNVATDSYSLCNVFSLLEHTAPTLKALVLITKYQNSCPEHESKSSSLYKRVSSAISSITNFHKSKCHDFVSGFKLFSNLRVLSLKDCSDITTLEFLIPCSKLEQLGLYRCSSLRDINQIIKFPLLNHFHLLEAPSITEIPSLEECHSLRELKISSCHDLINIGNLPLLTTFTVSSCHKLTNLNLPFSLENCKIETMTCLESIESIANCLNLKKFRFISCTKITDVSYLKVCSNLETLEFTKVSSEIFPDLSSFPKLRELRLRCAELTNLDVIRQVSCITSLYIVQRDSLQNINALQSFISLTELRISCSVEVVNLNAIANCINLVNLHLSSCPLLEDITTLRNCGKLVGLSLLRAVKLTDISSLASCGKLQHLYLDGAKSLKDISCLNCCSELYYLDLRRCTKLKSITVIPTLPKLGILKLIKSPIEDYTPILYCNSLEKVEIIDLKNVSKLIEVIDSFRKVKSDLRIRVTRTYENLSFSNDETMCHKFNFIVNEISILVLETTDTDHELINYAKQNGWI